ncbi:MAG: 5'-3' exonuclease H3TH domain-containing protein, partial [Alphaproteobacteria bacterium]
PEDLIPQFGLIRQATKAFNLPCIEKEGYEADDLIATYARMAEQVGAEVTIISSDKDLMQLVTPLVSMYDSMKDRQIGIAEVVEKWGVPPEKMIDLQALTGDSTDNVPGIPGIGPKTAAQLLEEFGDLDTLLARAGEIKQQKRRENILQYAEQALISRQLVTLKTDTPVDVGIEEFGLEAQDGPRLVAFLKSMEFNALTRRAAEATGVDAGEIAPAAVKVEAVAEARGPDLDSAEAAAGTVAETGEAPPATKPISTNIAASPADLVKSRTDESLAFKVDRSAYATIRDVASLQVWIDEAMASGILAFDTETTSPNPMQTEVVGISLATRPGHAAYIPINHRSRDGDLLGGGRTEGQLSEDEVFRLLKPLLEDASVLKIAHGMKYEWLVMHRHGIDLHPIDDTMLISYVLHAGEGGHSMDSLCDRWFGHKPLAYKDLIGSGKASVTFDKVDIDRATEYAAEDADITLRLWRLLKPQLVADGLASVYERLERPLVPVLARMEERGISVDRQILSRLSG